MSMLEEPALWSYGEPKDKRIVSSKKRPRLLFVNKSRGLYDAVRGGYWLGHVQWKGRSVKCLVDLPCFPYLAHQIGTGL